MKKLHIMDAVLFSVLFAFIFLTPAGAKKTEKPYVKPVAEEQSVVPEEVETKEPEKKTGKGKEEVRSTVETPAETVPEEEQVVPAQVTAQSPVQPVMKKNVPRNVILMVATGMGPSSYSLAKYYNRSVNSKQMNMEKVMESGSTGYMTNCSASALVPDEASAASSFACGAKIANGVISITPDGIRPKTILENMKKMGKSVGIVTNSELTDAVPASFSAHVESEAMKEEIALQQLASKIDVLLGGGMKWFDAVSRSDGKDLIEQAQGAEYAIVTTRNELSKIREKDFHKLLGLFSMRMMHFSAEKNENEPTLAHMTRVALSVLKESRNGFFLLVDGGRIAHASHANQAKNTMLEILAFDEAAGIALSYAEADPSTLLVITGLLETGGPAITKRGLEDEYPPVSSVANLEFMWLSHYNTSGPVFIFGMGPASEKLSGMRDNTDLAKIIDEAMAREKK